MTEAVLLLGKAAFGVGGLAAGLHLARQARRESGFPVHQWASATIFIGGIGLIGFGLAPLLAESSPAWARGLMIFFDACERLALLGLALFVWRVFGGGRPSRNGVFAVIAAVLLGDWILVLRVQDWPAPIASALIDALSQFGFALPVAWSAVEAGLEYARSRKQLRLGLCTRINSIRFALWSAGCGSLALVCLLAGVAALHPEGGPAVVATAWLRAALYVAIALMIWVGFFPPGFYLRLVDPPRPDYTPGPDPSGAAS